MVKAKYLFSLVILFLFSHAVVGQVLNIERLRLERDTTTSFKSKITAGMNIYNRSSAANEPVNLFGYNIDVNTLYYPGKHAFMGLAKFDYLKVNNEDFLNFGFVHFRVNYFRKNPINFEKLEPCTNTKNGHIPKPIKLLKLLWLNHLIIFLFVGQPMKM